MPDDLREADAPLISVVTRTLGHMPFLQRCAASLGNAARGSTVEWIVVDDAGTVPEDLEQRLYAGQASRPSTMRLVRSAARNRSVAANAGLSEARGSFVHFLDDDDQVLPGFYDKTARMLEASPRLGGAAVKCEKVLEEIAPNGRDFREISRRPHYPEVRSISLASFAVTQTVPLVSVLFRRDRLVQAGAFDTEFEVFEDYDLLLRCLAIADIGLLPDVLIRFRQRTTAAGSSANSASTTDFQAQNAYFRNAMLRRDLKAGRVGLGWLLAMGELAGGSVKTERILTQLQKSKLLQNAFSALRRR